MNDSVETVNAAATAIITAESRVRQVAEKRRRWGGCLSIYRCFGSERQEKRISRAALVPEVILPVPPGAPPTDNNLSQPPSLVLPYAAPPSSPASFQQSEPPSAIQSPAGAISFASLSANIYSPSGPASIFAIGPYANETQLVSPPVFSTFTTEPSTAPFTPPPEAMHLTTPSSPEVPFAQLLSSSFEFSQKLGDKKFSSSHYEFQSYQLYPGSPVGNLISPSSVISGSGTSSPFPDLEFPSFCPNEPPKLLKLDSLALRKLVPPQESYPTASGGAVTMPASENSSPLESSKKATVSQGDKPVLNPRLSFELHAEEADRKNLVISAETASATQSNVVETEVAEKINPRRRQPASTQHKRAYLRKILPTYKSRARHVVGRDRSRNSYSTMQMERLPNPPSVQTGG